MLKKLKFISNTFAFVLDQHRKFADGEISTFILFFRSFESQKGCRDMIARIKGTNELGNYCASCKRDFRPEADIKLGFSFGEVVFRRTSIASFFKKPAIFDA